MRFKIATGTWLSVFFFQYFPFDLRFLRTPSSRQQFRSSGGLLGLSLYLLLSSFFSFQSFQSRDHTQFTGFYLPFVAIIIYKVYCFCFISAIFLSFWFFRVGYFCLRYSQPSLERQEFNRSSSTSIDDLNY